MTILAIALLLIIAFDPSVALGILAIFVVVYGGYFIIAGYMGILGVSNHPAIIIIVTIAAIAALLIRWWRNGTKDSYDNICSINGKMFDLSKVIELVKQDDISTAIKEVHTSTELSWVDAKTLVTMIQTNGKVPGRYTVATPEIE